MRAVISAVLIGFEPFGQHRARRSCAGSDEFLIFDGLFVARRSEFVSRVGEIALGDFLAARETGDKGDTRRRLPMVLDRWQPLFYLLLPALVVMLRLQICLQYFQTKRG